LPSDNFRTLYRRLLDVVEKTGAAFDTMDESSLESLIQEHKQIMAALRKNGDCRENDMLKLVEKINNRVRGLGEKIQEQRDKLCDQLVMAERKKQVAAVYTNDALRLQAKKLSFRMDGNIHRR